MDKFELRFRLRAGRWTDWEECNNHAYIGKLFTRYINSIQHKYNDGSTIEYRRMK